MIGFDDIRSIEVPGQLVQHTINHLRNVGRRGFEGIALWAGMREYEHFYVTHSITPAQKLIHNSGHVCVSVGAEELHRLNVWLYENKRMLIAQIHSHPGEAYHSDTDDEFPIATVVGSLSLVVPDFGRNPFSLENCAVYRLNNRARWNELSLKEIYELIKITE